MGLYERLLAETAQPEEKENLEWQKHERLQAYIKSQRRGSPGGGGYVTSEEIREEQERYLTDLQALRNLLLNGVRGPYGGYRLAYLKRKYPMEYAHLRDIEIGSK